MKAAQRGEIGLVLSSQSFVPYSSKPEDVAASKRSMDFYLGWLVHLTNYHTHFMYFDILRFNSSYNYLCICMYTHNKIVL